MLKRWFFAAASKHIYERSECIPINDLRNKRILLYSLFVMSASIALYRTIPFLRSSTDRFNTIEATFHACGLVLAANCQAICFQDTSDYTRARAVFWNHTPSIDSQFFSHMVSCWVQYLGMYWYHSYHSYLLVYSYHSCYIRKITNWTIKPQKYVILFLLPRDIMQFILQKHWQLMTWHLLKAIVETMLKLLLWYSGTLWSFWSTKG